MFNHTCCSHNPQNSFGCIYFFERKGNRDEGDRALKYHAYHMLCGFIDEVPFFLMLSDKTPPDNSPNNSPNNYIKIVKDDENNLKRNNYLNMRRKKRGWEDESPHKSVTIECCGKINDKMILEIKKSALDNQGGFYDQAFLDFFRT